MNSKLLAMAVIISLRRLDLSAGLLKNHILQLTDHELMQFCANVNTFAYTTALVSLFNERGERELRRFSTKNF
jgi:uncharacterized membrane protein YGL010W